MDWQLVTSLTIVGLAVLSLAWRSLRGWRADVKSGCGGGCCGKPAAPAQEPALIPPEQLVLRR